MIDELKPVWKQFEETYWALRESLAAVPHESLNWSVKPDTWTPSLLVQHIGRGNVLYSQMIAREELVRDRYRSDLDQGALTAILDRTEERVRGVFEAVSETDAHVQLDDSWNPLGPRVEGSLDAIWFAHQIVRHSAYHLGQLNYLAQLGGFAKDYE
jgi:hypothetical protein